MEMMFLWTLVETVTIKTFSRNAVIDGDILPLQAGLIYELSMKAYQEGNLDGYNYLQGVAAMLYHLQSGYYRIVVEEEFDNTRKY
jgi:hypothetical protein